MENKLSFPRIVMAYVLSGHVMTALVMLFSGEGGVRVGKKLYGASFEADERFVYILRPAGAYVLTLSFLQALAIREPQRYKGVFDATLLVFLIRQLQRIFLRGDVYRAFGISPSRHWASTIYFQSVAALLLLARLRVKG
ncbi:MAG: hypothetical protein M3220_10390 [Chloroflexota bacterium]|nr:hypothetical protein [Chloroflexota bacterium]